MATIADFSLAKLNDGVITIDMTPPVPIGGWEINFDLMYRLGAEQYIFRKSVASGYGNGVSGITITNSGQGVFNVAVWNPNSSGLQFGNYAFTATRMTSGARTLLTEGFMLLNPG